MNQEYLLNYINYQKDKFRGIKLLWQIYAGSVLFGFLSFFFAPMFIKSILIIITISIFPYMIILTIRKRADWLILGYALAVTNFTLVSIFLAYIVILTVTVIPVYVLGVMVLLYILASIMDIMIVVHYIKKNIYAKKKKFTPAPLWIASISGVVGWRISKIVFPNVNYNTGVIIVVICATIMTFAGICGSHLYFCFYHMRKYKIK
jgi:hypothetical protein